MLLPSGALIRASGGPACFSARDHPHHEEAKLLAYTRVAMTIPGRSFSEADRLILGAVSGGRALSDSELERVLEHVARAGFDPNARERVRGRLAGFNWQGRVLAGADLLSPAEKHYVWHVLHNQEWPQGTSLQEYLDSIRQVILDPTSGVFTSEYQGAAQLGVVRESRELRGPAAFAWVLVEYRVDRGHWMTAFQPSVGLPALQGPNRSDLRWWRRPRSSGGP